MRRGPCLGSQPLTLSSSQAWVSALGQGQGSSLLCQASTPAPGASRQPPAAARLTDDLARQLADQGGPKVVLIALAAAINERLAGPGGHVIVVASDVRLAGARVRGEPADVCSPEQRQALRRGHEPCPGSQPLALSPADPGPARWGKGADNSAMPLSSTFGLASTPAPRATWRFPAAARLTGYLACRQAGQEGHKVVFIALTAPINERSASPGG